MHACVQGRAAGPLLKTCLPSWPLRPAAPPHRRYPSQTNRSWIAAGAMFLRTRPPTWVRGGTPPHAAACALHARCHAQGGSLHPHARCMLHPCPAHMLSVALLQAVMAATTGRPLATLWRPAASRSLGTTRYVLPVVPAVLGAALAGNISASRHPEAAWRHCTLCQLLPPAAAALGHGPPMPPPAAVQGPGRLLHGQRHPPRRQVQGAPSWHGTALPAPAQSARQPAAQQAHGLRTRCPISLFGPPCALCAFATLSPSRRHDAAPRCVASRTRRAYRPRHHVSSCTYAATRLPLAAPLPSPPGLRPRATLQRCRAARGPAEPRPAGHLL